MKRFHFPLKSVAIVREAREARVRESFTAAVRAVVAAERSLDKVRAEKSDLEKVMLEERRESFRAADQVAFLQSHRQIAVLEDQARLRVQEAVEMRELRRREWLEARRDVRLIEKLRESALAEHYREREREAQRFLDDHTCAAVARETGTAA